MKALGVRVVAAQAVVKPRSLDLQGSLALDTNRLVRVHSRFAGEVIDLGETPKPGAAHAKCKDSFPLSGFGDHVAKDQLLAVVWCKDLGEKKSELADALSQLAFDQEQLAKMSEAAGRRRIGRQAPPAGAQRGSRLDGRGPCRADAARVAACGKRNPDRQRRGRADPGPQRQTRSGNREDLGPRRGPRRSAGSWSRRTSPWATSSIRPPTFSRSPTSIR